MASSPHRTRAKPVVAFLIALAAYSTPAYAVDTYAFTAYLYVPRVYDNMSSQGRRAYQRQRLTGYLDVEPSDSGEPVVTLRGVTNINHKVSGANVTYTITECTSVRWHTIGSNKTGVFSMASISFSAMLEPSYSISDTVTEDNALVLEFSGRGRMTSVDGARYAPGIVQGGVSGSIGCGCANYGHVSPTRIIGPRGASDIVVDIAAVWGTWRIRRVK